MYIWLDTKIVGQNFVMGMTRSCQGLAKIMLRPYQGHVKQGHFGSDLTSFQSARQPMG